MAKTTDIEIPHPRENPRLIGHDVAAQRFIEEFEQGKPHHAYLISGVKGIGKATVAYHFARYILSHGAQTAKQEEAPSMSLFGEAEPTPKATETQSLHMDPESSLFRRIAASSHTDLLSVSPAYDAKKHVEKNIISVDDARKVPEFLSLTPAEGLWRVVIVDAVDQLNINAANALLKILEEPPARAMLFLVCHQPAAILPTIRSRCRALKLTAPDEQAFSEILSHIAPSIEIHEYAALYALSGGSPGYAITLFQEEGLKWYEGWLKAMHPAATAEARQKFADSASALKSPSGWAAIIHGWRTAMHRLSLYPNYASNQPILRKEDELLSAITESMRQPQRTAWLEQGTKLIRETETFNLDKRYTIRLLTTPAQLDMLAS
ncbi:MAG: DNA polymerase III subunit delta' [Rickettsiales bacterium]